MASLKEIRGIDIEVRTSDPENPESGQVWYNTTTELLKGYKQVVGNAWSTGGNMNQSKRAHGSAGTQTATLSFGGSSGPVALTNTETYDGTSWTEVNDLNTARSQIGSAGIQTSALLMGGNTFPGPVVASNESWNGTSWTEVNDLNQARRLLAGDGADNT